MTSLFESELYGKYVRIQISLLNYKSLMLEKVTIEISALSLVCNFLKIAHGISREKPVYKV